MDEAKPKKKKSNRGKNLLVDLATLFVIVVIAVLTIVLVGQSDGSNSSPGESIKITGLHCEKSSPDSPFLGAAKLKPISATHKVSANFKSDNLTDAMYSYTAIFQPGTNLSQVKTNLHIDFDLAYGNALVHRDGVWSESFSTSEEDNSVHMSVYSEAGNLKSSNAEAFMLQNGEPFPKTMSSLREAYENAGFACQVSE